MQTGLARALRRPSQRSIELGLGACRRRRKCCALPRVDWVPCAGHSTPSARWAGARLRLRRAGGDNRFNAQACVIPHTANRSTAEWIGTREPGATGGREPAASACTVMVIGDLGVVWKRAVRGEREARRSAVERLPSSRRREPQPGACPPATGGVACARRTASRERTALASAPAGAQPYAKSRTGVPAPRWPSGCQSEPRDPPAAVPERRPGDAHGVHHVEHDVGLRGAVGDGDVLAHLQLAAAARQDHRLVGELVGVAVAVFAADVDDGVVQQVVPLPSLTASICCSSWAISSK